MINYIKKQFIKKNSEKKMVEILCKEDFLPIKNIIPKKVTTVVFVVARILEFSGGYTSILRLGTQLENNNIKVYYAVSSKIQTIQEAQKNALTNLKDYRGEIIKLDNLYKVNYDVLIATYWRTVYETKKMKGYKIYFIQDYEPYFFQYGEEYLLARKSYELGYHMVSLGRWNKHMIEHECGKKSNLQYIDFPFERTEYRFIKRDYSLLRDKKEYIIAAFIKKDQKRIPNIVNTLLGNLAKEFKKNGKKLNVKFFGINKSFDVSCGENMGILNKKEIFNLYKEADFGICASMTNVSLVPYEMLATGLPLIEFEDGTFPFFFPEETAILTDFSYKNLYVKLIKNINNPTDIERMIDKAQQYLNNLSWDRTGKQFVNILKNL